MNRIFGNAKPQAPKPTLNDAVGKVDSRGQAVEQKIAKLDQDLAKYTEQMRKMKPGPAKNGVKQRAMQVLKQKKMYEQQRSQMMAQQFNMEQIMFTQETMKDTADTVNAMKTANKEMKKQFKTMDVSQVEDLQDDMSDMLEQANEIQDVLGRNYALDDVDDDDLESELAALEEDPSLFASENMYSTGMNEAEADYLSLPDAGTAAAAPAAAELPEPEKGTAQAAV